MSAPIRVLCVDDSALIRGVMTEIINSHPDMTVVATAPDPLVARELIKRHSPDVLTLDVEMPHMDGLEATRKIREYEVSNGLDRTPVIGLTAGVFSDERDNCFAAGMDDVLAKPVSFRALRECLQRWLGDPRVSR